ncbi:hypothetical protein BJ875DRAFT_58242 [Amylocarpus encephaloides]|uniref:Uncharacterized protein n=1 Tax=Amylocarpus encephaloides TaxID=45428 RepID=A0A9P7YGR2_9HELO|nr:hypothetical protein BJ875DRAFT_58242 [Amylocarpus encephaloides]
MSRIWVKTLASTQRLLVNDLQANYNSIYCAGNVTNINCIRFPYSQKPKPEPKAMRIDSPVFPVPLARRSFGPLLALTPLPLAQHFYACARVFPPRRPLSLHAPLLALALALAPLAQYLFRSTRYFWLRGRPEDCYQTTTGYEFTYESEREDEGRQREYFGYAILQRRRVRGRKNDKGLGDSLHPTLG